MSKDAFLAEHPGHPLEVEPEPRDVPCVSCGALVTGYSGRAVNVKCEDCRKTPAKRKRVGVDGEGLVACRICGVARKRLGAHLKAAHGLSDDRYLTLYPDALVEVPGSRVRSTACRAKQSVAATRRWSDPAERVAQSERLQASAPWKGKHLSEEHRGAISDGLTGVPHNLSEEGRAVLQSCGRQVLDEVRHRPDYPAKLAAGVQRRIARGEIVGLMDPAAQKKSYESRVRNGTLVPPNSGRGICGWRKGLSHYTRSTLEANFSHVLIAAGVLYEYEGRLFKLPSGRHYLPDFYLHQPLPVGDEEVPAGWVELKGWRQKDGSLPPGAEDKIGEFEEHLGTSVFVLVGTDELWKGVQDLYRPGILLWESPRRNLRSHPEVFGR
jgi:hypothetical protein